MNHSSLKKLRVGVVGTYPPRRCGIATFTQDVCNAMCAAADDPGVCQVVALDDLPQGYNYSDRVRFQIRQEDPASYRRAADFMNIRGVNLLLVQHEFGIFGGRDGAHLLALMHEARMPILTTFHTVLSQPGEHLDHLTRKIIQLSERVVVMSHRATGILQETAEAPAEKIRMIPHGIPDIPFVEPAFYKDRFGVENRTVLLTFGLLSPAKGIEYVLRALPPLVGAHPDLIYIVLGATHPHVRRESGEEYRRGLQRLVDELGLQQHVRFDDNYADLPELCEYLGAADIYITPYLGEQQIVSGTLSYALGAGKAVISTPYSYAKEMLADGRGCLIPFRNSEALTREIANLLDNPRQCQTMRKKAYLYTRDMVWRRVGEKYLELCEEVVRQPRRLSRGLHRRLFDFDGSRRKAPEIDLRHIRALTDDTGMLQHARYTIPNREHGYCTDDNARALQFALLAYEQTQKPELIDLARVYLAFLQHAYNPQQRRFRNFMAYDRRWLEEVGSEDSHGRAMAAPGLAVASAPTTGMRMVAVDLFDDALAASAELTAARAIADVLLGIHTYLRRYSGDADVRRIREELAVRLFEQFREHAGEDWPWPEPVLTYAPGKLPHALLLAGQWLPRGDMIDLGLQSLDWLLRTQTGPAGEFSPVGNRGWWPRGGEKARFDQQPLDAQAMIEACIEAFNVTGERRWAAEARRCFHWFQGKNALGLPLADYATGGCRDGLIPQGVNQNEGAESTLTWLLSLLAIAAFRPEGPDLPLAARAVPQAIGNGHEDMR